MAALVGGLIPGPRADLASGDDVTIHLVAGPIHTDILVPLDAATAARFAQYGMATDTPGAEWLVVGWGARDFYTTTGTYADVSLRAIWRAITGDSAVMRLGLAGPLDPALRTWPIAISAAQHTALLDQIESDIDTPTPLPHAGFGAFDRFYSAAGRFHIFNTCNTWVARTLRAAGIPFGAWTPTPYAIRAAHIKHH
ncbi:MAG: DUF2459 domain-containing protein [Pseudomonadota bacterium]